MEKIGWTRDCFTHSHYIESERMNIWINIRGLVLELNKIGINRIFIIYINFDDFLAGKG